MTHRAFVAGATGYTGKAVVAELRRRDVETIAHIRPDSSRRAQLTESFEALGATVDTSPWEQGAITSAIVQQRPTMVFGLLGTTAKRARASKKEGKADGYDVVDYGMSVMLLRGCEELDPLPRYVYLSSLGVSDSARGAYMQARARVEAELRRSNVPWTIARPSIITGPDRDETRRGESAAAVVADAALGALAAFGANRLRARYRSRTADELAAALVTLALGAQYAGKTVEAEELDRLAQ